MKSFGLGVFPDSTALTAAAKFLFASIRVLIRVHSRLFLRSFRSFVVILFPHRADIPSGHSIRDPQVQKRSGFYGGNDRYLGFRHWRYERNLQRGKRGPASPAPISAFGPGGHVDGTKDRKSTKNAKNNREWTRIRTRTDRNKNSTKDESQKGVATRERCRACERFGLARAALHRVTSYKRPCR